jgi:flagellar hook assembly protein FlgD
VADDPAPAPELVQPAFYPARPNPFNPSTALAFNVPGEVGGARPVTLEIYDVGGRLVRRLVAGPVGTGQQTVLWDGRSDNGRGVGSGTYFAHITIGSFAATQKLTLVR